MSILDRINASFGLDPAALREEIEQLRQRLESQEHAASQRQQLLQSVVDAAPAAIVLLDQMGTIVFANTGARELFFETEEPEGQNFLRMLAAVPGPLREALLSDADHIFRYAGHGESETYHLAKRHLTLGSEPHSVLIVRTMTAELSRQENAVLRKAIRVIHHEFANSLAPVISLLRSARTRLGQLGLLEGTPKLEQMLSVIEDRVLHLNTFLTGFAALGRLPKPSPQAVVWEAFLAQLRPLLADITIAPAPAGAGWFDPAQLQQVIINLVKNAREAGSEPAQITLEVSEAQEGGHRVSVLDRGTGMSDEVLENATVPSFTTKPTGSGMGLALCKEIVDAHQGRLRVGRRDGGGAVVTCWLPGRDGAVGVGGVAKSRAQGTGRLTLSRF